MRRLGQRPMGRVARWLLRIVAGLALVVALLLAPVGYVELACQGTAKPDAYAPILPAEARRPEARTLLTYPEWHIVHAYADYGAVIGTGDPHDFRFLPAIAGFWSSLCTLNEAAASHGGADGGTRLMVHTIGVSFTAELLLKAAYEETLGRLFAALRGPERAPLDGLSAAQAAGYADFLRQVPWYRWDFRADAQALNATATDALRDRERALALGLEYRAKAAYAGVIAGAVAGIGPDALTLRSVVSGLDAASLSRVAGVTVIAERSQGVEIETARYAAFTEVARDLADLGADFVEIAGNDDILFTVVSPGQADAAALSSLRRQGNEGYRHLRLVKVAALAEALRRGGASIEHVHDY